ncbi:MAG: hypothetical protein JW904_08500 [Spirochaetales bacterium]|nr:hypothetical protein [Spirochaetales bacterium]
MRKTIFYFFGLVLILTLTSCDFLSNAGDMSQVSIALPGADGSRAIGGFPADITITGYTVTVFGPGMQPVRKQISPGARYVNLYVPAGENRHFTLEAYFTPNNPDTYAHPHLRSFKGRASTDLLPGRIVALRFKMSAGATQLLVPDYSCFDPFLSSAVIHYADTLEDFSLNQVSNLAAFDIFNPTDLAVSSDGRIFAASDGDTALYWADNVAGLNSSAFSTTISVPRAMAIDHDANADMNGDTELETEILYVICNVSDTDSVLYAFDLAHIEDVGYIPVQFVNVPDLTNISITGMDVDPWTHHLFMVGRTTGGSPQPVIIEFDPTVFNSGTGTEGELIQVLNGDNLPPGLSTLLDPMDIIVKDYGIFVLNQVAPEDPNLPVLLRFSRNLEFEKGYGRVSSFLEVDGQWYYTQTYDPWKFYETKRFINNENRGLYIVDDGWDNMDNMFEKVVHIDVNIQDLSVSWSQYPASAADAEYFDFGFPF